MTIQEIKELEISWNLEKIWNRAQSGWSPYHKSFLINKFFKENPYDLKNQRKLFNSLLGIMTTTWLECYIPNIGVWFKNAHNNLMP